MKKYEISKELILELYNIVGSRLKPIIEKEVPELFEKKLEVGKWYKSIKGNIAFNQGYDVRTYGLSKENGWNENAFWFNDFNITANNSTLATKEEVEEALIKEAKKRGFKIGDKVIDAKDGKIEDIKREISSSEYYWSTGCLDNWAHLFHNGKWAEIIEEEIKEVTFEEAQAAYKELHGCKIKIVES